MADFWEQRESSAVIPGGKAVTIRYLKKRIITNINLSLVLILL